MKTCEILLQVKKKAIEIACDEKGHAEEDVTTVEIDDEGVIVNFKFTASCGCCDEYDDHWIDFRKL